METLKSISVTDWVTILIILGAIARVVCKRRGYDKGVEVIDELRDALLEAKRYINDAKSTGDLLSMEKASKTIAAHVTGVSHTDVSHLVSGLIANGEYNAGGIKVSLGADGTPTVDASGFVTGKVGKAGKWLKKIF